MKVSLLYVTNRPGGMDVLLGNVLRQTFGDFETVIIDGYEGRTVSEPPKKEGRLTNIWASYNEGLRQCHSELVVFLQDYIWIGPAGIKRFVEDQERQAGFYTGVGNVGEGPDYYQDDAVSTWKEPWYNPPERIRWMDPRIGAWQGQIVEIGADAWENNWACAPLKALRELGGFDEEYDLGWGWAEKDLALRAEAAGHKLYMDTGNRCMAWWHTGLLENPLRTDEEAGRRNRERFERRVAELRTGNR